MKTIRAAIVDDEAANLHIIKSLLENQCTDVEVVWTADNLEDAHKHIREQEVDVIFLDIEMPPYSSFDLLQNIEDPHFEIIFVTAYQEYALKAIKMAALDYILKPVKAADIRDVIEKLRNTNKNKFGELTSLLKDHLKTKSGNFSKIVVHVTDGYEIVDINDIIYVEALDSYAKIKLPKNVSYVTSRSLKEYDEMLCDKGFYRIHKSYLVNFHHIMKILKGISASVIMTNGDCIPISARRKEEFFNELKGLISF